MVIEVKHIKTLFYILVGIFLLFVLFMENKTNKNPDSNRTELINLEFEGFVKSKYKDWDAHKFPELILNDNSSIYMYEEIINNIQIGDYISKKSGVYDLLIIRNKNDSVYYNLKKLFEIHNY
ncbi:MAG: hypothetical protein ACK48V_05795 [Crocinitomicaceae bacterium]